jgi:hypothetical protein
MKIFNLETFKYKYIRIGASLLYDEESGRKVLRVSGKPEGAPGSEKETILIHGARRGFFRLIVRVAGNVKADWAAVLASLKSAIKSMGEGQSPVVVQ